MTTPFLGEIRIMSFNFAPRGWAKCEGQILPISQYARLFELLGKTYGGDGKNNFALPNLQGRAPLHQGNGFTIGQVTGEYRHTLDINELATHTHSMNVSATGPFVDAPGQVPGNNRPSEARAAPAPGTPLQIWGTGPNNLKFSTAAISSTGGGGSHNNQQPYLTVNFCIALQGVPPQP
jgi:microcystin-dependent protein